MKLCSDFVFEQSQNALIGKITLFQCRKFFEWTSHYKKMSSVTNHPTNSKLVYFILLLVAYCLVLTFQHLYDLALLSARTGNLLGSISFKFPTIHFFLCSTVLHHFHCCKHSLKPLLLPSIHPPDFFPLRNPSQSPTHQKILSQKFNFLIDVSNP